MKTKVLIVGDGLAAVTLALHLFEKKVPFKLVGEFHKKNASSVAAGICNPVVFRRLNPSWNVNVLMDYCRSFYTRIETHFKSNFFQEIQIQKLIRSTEEIEFWNKRIHDPAISDFVDLEESLELDESWFHPLIGLGISKGIRLDTVVFLEVVYDLLRSKGHLIEEKLNIEELDLGNNSLNWKEVTAEKVVFCEGHDITKNQYFSYLPMKPVKGEVLIVEMKGLDIANVVHDKVSVCPLGNNLYWVGATYNWNKLDNEGTDEGKQFLVASLKNIFKKEFRVVDHYAGVRPAIADRRPVIGRHPQHLNLWVFNGLGTKGTMQAPWAADQLVQYMLNEREPIAEINVNRFDRLLAD